MQVFYMMYVQGCNYYKHIFIARIFFKQISKMSQELIAEGLGGSGLR